MAGRERNRVSAAAAETMALEALAWLVGQEELIGVFLGATGAAEADLRRRAEDPEFLGAVLDFILMDDAWVVAFGDACGVAYDDVGQARAVLPGGEAIHWT